MGTTIPGVDPADGEVELDPVDLASFDPDSCPNVALPAQETLPADMPDEAIADAQAEVRSDMERLQAYVAEHRDDLGDPWYQNGLPMRLGVTIDANVEQHCMALRSKLEQPDRPEIRVGFSTGTLEGIIGEMQRDWPHSGYVASVQKRRVVAHLWPGEQEAAEEMTARYGDAVELWVGRQRHPDRHIQEECLAWLTETTEPFVEVQALPLEVEVGGRFAGVATLTNPGPDDVSTSDVGLQAVVVEDGTVTPLAVVTGPDSAEIEDDRLEPGESTQATFVGGTASCGADVEYTLPRGDYEYRILVVTPRAPEIDDVTLVGFWSDPFPLTVK